MDGRGSPPTPPVPFPNRKDPQMTRVIAGTAGGRRLAVPPGTGTRPTSDRAREGLFSTWDSLHEIAGARVLDLYGGSGAVGLEALSRGAAHALLVEADPKAARVIRENIAALRLPGAEARTGRAEQIAAGPAPADPYDLVFLDPPYAVENAELCAILRALADGGWLAEDALITAERATRGGVFPWPEGFEPLRSRRYGEGTLWYARAVDAG
ncbi:16S rRNA (guanine(966)-N(2))-methyltransferase RsmD [Streptomyces sp. BI20]|uniref:16S rRNA (guanine(966)-N(2))-methyltransferase RsmD n=1 Tax=Streptomyces sp. BI20 TaxID=3403460 RepID=UPI003C77C3EC